MVRGTNSIDALSSGLMPVDRLGRWRRVFLRAGAQACKALHACSLLFQRLHKENPGELDVRSFLEPLAEPGAEAGSL